MAAYGGGGAHYPSGRFRVPANRVLPSVVHKPLKGRSKFRWIMRKTRGRRPERTFLYVRIARSPGTRPTSGRSGWERIRHERCPVPNTPPLNRPVSSTSVHPPSGRVAREGNLKGGCKTVWQNMRPKEGKTVRNAKKQCVFTAFPAASAPQNGSNI